MALTSDQQFQMDIESVRHANQMAAEAKRSRVELIRLAKETLIENARNKTPEESIVSATDIVAFAQQLAAYADA